MILQTCALQWYILSAISSGCMHAAANVAGIDEESGCEGARLCNLTDHLVQDDDSEVASMRVTLLQLPSKNGIKAHSAMAVDDDSQSNRSQSDTASGCVDAPGWSNGYARCYEESSDTNLCTTSGWTCQGYSAKGWCNGGALTEAWTGGPEFNAPERNCCACGGGSQSGSSRRRRRGGGDLVANLGPPYYGPATVGGDSCRSWSQGGCRVQSQDGRYAHKGVNSFWATCQDSINRCCSAACYLWDQASRAQPEWNPVWYSNLAIPRSPISGLEGIDSTNAAAYNFMWQAAADKVGHSRDSVLLVNPYCCRSMHQMHMFRKYLTYTGSGLKGKLERQFGCQTGVWLDAEHSVNNLAGCSLSQSIMFDTVPGAFTEVLSRATSCDMCLGEMKTNQQGRSTLGRIGISLMFSTACGGTKYILLATTTRHTGCSLEHSIAH